jgi:hypothetical protein
MPAFNRSALIRKSLLTLVLITLALTAAIPRLHGQWLQSALGILDEQASIHIEDTMTRAMYTFAAARGINALVSVIQGTTVAVSPAGVGLNMSIGEVLDPINDLIERFSWVMLVSTTSLGLQRVLMDIGSWLALEWLLAAALLSLALSLWWSAPGGCDLRRMGRRLLILALVVKFFIPLYALTAEGVYQRFLAARYQEATRSLDTLREELHTTAAVVARDPEANPSQGYLQDMRRLLEDTRDLMNLRTHIDRLKTKMHRLTEHAVSLIVVFTLQTILLPLFMLWLIGRVVRLTPRLALPVMRSPSVVGRRSEMPTAPDARSNQTY